MAGSFPRAIFYDSKTTIFDVNGAMAFGMQRAYVNREGQERDEPQREPHYEVSDLLEFAEMIEAGKVTAPERE